MCPAGDQGEELDYLDSKEEMIGETATFAFALLNVKNLNPQIKEISADFNWPGVIK